MSTDPIQHEYWPNATWVLTQYNISTDPMQHEYWPNATWILTQCNMSTDTMQHEYWHKKSNMNTDSKKATWILTQCNMSTDTMQHEYWPNATWICTNHLSVSHLLPKWLQQSYLGKITSVAKLIVDSPFDKLLYLINTLKTFCVSDCCEQMLNKTLTD